MSNDVTLLKVFSIRENYDSYIQCIQLDLLEWEIRDVLFAYQAYFTEFDVKQIDFDNFFTWFTQSYKSNLPEAQYKIFEVIIKRIPEASADVAGKVVEKFQELATTEKIRQCLEEGFSRESLVSAIEDHDKGIKDTKCDQDRIVNDLDAILQSTVRQGGLSWRLDCLNECIGPLSKGMFILVAAYVDVGKTMFAISEAACMARQLDSGCILWLNNEEHDLRVMEKMWRSVLGISANELTKHKTSATLQYEKRMHGDIDRIKFFNIRNQSIASIKKKFKEHNPKLVVIDQLDKITNNKYKPFSDHDRLKNLYGEIRSLANEYCPIIGVSQADASTAWLDKDTKEMCYQLYPHHRQLDGSKIGKPGEADAIIMIGRRHDTNNTRGLHVSKNKFGLTMKREVPFNGEKARYENT